MSNYGQSESSIYIDMVERSRYLNINLFFNVQSLFLPSAILQGCQINICKQLCNQDEARKAKSIMNFSMDEQTNAMMGLKPFDAIYIDKKRSDVPIHIILPNYPAQLITDEMINQIQGDTINKILNEVVHEKPDIIKATIEKELSYNAKIIMEDLKKFPFDFQSEREIRLNINARIIAENLDELVLNGWLRRHESKINLGKGKGQFQPYIFTEKAVKEFGKQEIKGKGSIEHAFWQYRCSKHFTEKGYNVEIEYFLTGEKNNE